ncbi:winged helix-turn-helix domain-containing protein [Streptomyces sp. GC420]|uniref:winged helix-turn-helix domain-containing protein n=1 Tax=Streptomyces sp. GC420 TaxID=2697568 RepID=UPI0014150279|nr:winged helix-turn-helix domain-containing protein [Streptomyces sp. GC420]NBM17591.1 helix-turn-helix domain-containing protein [Streptomyces sp. GC420]
MRYPDGGGCGPGGRLARERVRLEAAERFVRGEKTTDIAREFRVSVRRVEKWRRAWREGGVEALRSKGPASRERLSPQQWARVEAELKRGPLAHGFEEDQRWTLGRIKTLIGRLCHVGYTVPGVRKLLIRHGWTCQVPLRRAVERDEEAIEVWKDEVWPRVKAPRRTWAPISASRTSRGRA